MEHAKRILIIAGPNGAGKTTFARSFLLNEADVSIFINADLIAAGLSPLQPESEAMQAGRLMLSMIDHHVQRGDSFAFETTLSGRGYSRMIPQWRELGYRVELHFLRLPTPEIAIARVMQRVTEGGHSVPPEVIRRRFHARWYNFENIYRDLVNHWAVWTTVGNRTILLEKRGDDDG
jgi:predicted ABC-type ATPase